LQQIKSLYFEDWLVGDTYTSTARIITENDVAVFADLTGDHHLLHTDEEYARKSIYGSRIVHGFLGMSIAMGLWAGMDLVLMSGRANLGLDSWRFRAPIRFGDKVYLKANVVAKRKTAKGDAGILTFHFQLINQANEVVQEGDSIQMVALRS